MTPFPNVGYITALDGKVIPLPPHLIQRSGVAYASDVVSMSAVAYADVPNLSVALTLEVPCAVFLIATLYSYASGARIAYFQFTDVANVAIGMEWRHSITDSADRHLITPIALGVGVVGLNTFKLRWKCSAAAAISLAERYMIALAWPS